MSARQAIRREYCANMALAASVGIVQRQAGRRVNAAARRMDRRAARLQSLKNAAGGAAFVFLFSAAFLPLFF